MILRSVPVRFYSSVVQTDRRLDAGKLQPLHHFRKHSDKFHVSLSFDLGSLRIRTNSQPRTGHPYASEIIFRFLGDEDA